MKKHIPKQIFNESGCLSFGAMKRYLNGGIKGNEKADFEQHLAGCLFCREAMEGMGAVEDQAKTEQAVDDINSRVDNVVKKQVNITKPEVKRIDKTWMYLSAAASVLVVAGLYTLFKLQQQPTDNLISERISTMEQTKEEQIPREPSKAKPDKNETMLHEDVRTRQVAVDDEDDNINELPEDVENSEDNEKAKVSAPVEEPKDRVADVGVTEGQVKKEFITKDEDVSDDAATVETEAQEVVVVGYGSVENNYSAGSKKADKKSMQRSSPAPKINQEEDVFYKLEEMPHFRGGGKDVFSQYIQEQIMYPSDAVEQEKEGQVIVEFTVTREGKVKNVKVVEGIYPSLDKEALRVVSASPEWSPGIQNGKPVDVRYKFAVKFSLGD